MRAVRAKLAVALTLASGPAAAASSKGLELWRGKVAGQAFTSPVYAVSEFDRAVLSWNADGPALFELEAGGDGQWRVMGRWSERPRSQDGQAEVDVDTLKLKTPAKSFRFRVTPENGATVTLVAVTYWKAGDREPFSAAKSPAWGRTIEVPRRSQGVEAVDPSKICSPTSLSMVLEHYGVKKPTAEVARGVYDHQEKIYGNWPFNTAYAHAALGREAYVRRFSGLAGLEEEIAAGRPVVISHKWRKGELDGAPINDTDGHLIVVVGFDASGDVVVNDPAAPPASVRRVYKREQLHKTFLERGSGIAYIIQN